MDGSWFLVRERSLVSQAYLARIRVDTTNDGFVREFAEHPLNSGLGSIVVCPEVFTNILNIVFHDFEWIVEYHRMRKRPKNDLIFDIEFRQVYKVAIFHPSRMDGSLRVPYLDPKQLHPNLSSPGEA